MHDIKIKPVLNGYIVEVGCKTVVFPSRKKLLRELDRYLQDPEGVEEEYRKKYQKPLGEEPQTLFGPEVYYVRNPFATSTGSDSTAVDTTAS